MNSKSDYLELLLSVCEIKFFQLNDCKNVCKIDHNLIASKLVVIDR